MSFSRASIALILVLALLIPSAHAQLEDGECVVPLDYSKFEDAVEEAGIFDPGDYAVSAPLMANSPTADGVISDGEYPNTCFYSFFDRENPGNPWPGLDNIESEEDLNMTMHLAHTDEYLFLGFEITDDFLDLDEGAFPFRNDSVELFLNPNLIEDGAMGPGKMQLVADAAGDGDVEFNNRFTSGAGPQPVFEPDPQEGEFYTAGIPYENEEGYTLEYQIPLGSLDKEGFEFGEDPMTTGDFLLFNIAIDDNDEPTDAQTGHHILWQVEGTGSPFGGGEPIWVVPLELSPAVEDTPTGDYNGDGVLDETDIDMQSAEMKKPAAEQDLAKYDHNNDGVINVGSPGPDQGNWGDRLIWIRTLRETSVGDSNFDGVFDSGDLVLVFAGGEYESGNMAGWKLGDWNGDMLFDSGDLVFAFSDGGYVSGAAAAVPEPSTLTLALIGAVLFWFRRQR